MALALPAVWPALAGVPTSTLRPPVPHGGKLHHRCLRKLYRGKQIDASSLQEYASGLLELHTGHAGRPLETLEEHNEAVARFLTEAGDRWSGEAVPVEVRANVEAALDAVPGLGPDTRAVCVLQMADDCVVEALQARGVLDVLAVDACSSRLSGLQGSSQQSTCGNDLGLRTWEGDLTSMPDYLCRAELVVFCGSLGRMYSLRGALLKAMMAVKAGGHIVVCEPLGRSWQNQAAAADPRHMPNSLPDRNGLEELLRDLSLNIVSIKDDELSYSALLQVPPTRSFQGSPLYIDGNVTYGFGRGSKQMGVPTANLPPEPLQDRIGTLPAGVYFGWAQLQSGKGSDGEVHKMVMNIGYRPTYDDGGGLTVELHILHSYAGDFYGEPLRAVVLGYIRPEMRFSGLSALVARIKSDIGIARATLDLPELASLATDEYFSS